jgi:glycosyltransferase involved in cell wall biosynthesis
MRTEKKKYIIHLPRWYPDKKNPQNGIFVRKHILSVKSYGNIVLYASPTNNKSLLESKMDVARQGNTTHFIYYYRSANKLTNIIRYAVGIIHCYRLAVKVYGPPSIIHAHILLRTYVLAFLMSRLLKIPYIISEHWSGYHYGVFEKKSLLYKGLTRLCFKNASAVTVVSQRLKDDIRKQRLAEPNKIEVIPNVVELPTLRKKKKKESIKMLTIADLRDDIKNISSIINVFSALNFPMAEYHIIGDGKDAQNLKKLANEKGVLDKTVFFHGEFSNEKVLSTLHEYDFLVVNSLYETFGLVVPEALAAGLPVICTKNGCPESVQTEKNGIFINAESEKELEMAIRTMLGTFKKYNTAEIRGQLTAEFGFDIIGNKFETIYKKIG